MKTFIRSVILSLSLLLLGGCAGLLNKLSYQQLEDKTRGYEGTASSLLADTDNPELARFLEQSRQEEARLARTVEELQQRQKITPQQADKLKEIHQSLRRLQLEKTRAILNAYHEVTVEFVHLNNTTLLPEAKAVLRAVAWGQYCSPGRKIIVYGYGDPIGGQEPTLRISEGRARAVAYWLDQNTDCHSAQILARGLGVDVKAEEIREADIPEAEKLKLYEKSRYVRILAPK